MHVGLFFLDRPFVTLTLISNSWESRPFNKVPDCPQTRTSNCLRVQEKGIQISMSGTKVSHSQKKSMNGGFLLCFTPSTQGIVNHSHLVEIFSQVVSCKKASNYPGLCPIEYISLILAALF
jgi:hypothetical protein